MIATAPIDDLGMIDKEMLVRSVEEAALGVADPRKLQRLNLTLSLIAWLSAQPRWQRGSSQPTRSIRLSYALVCLSTKRKIPFFEPASLDVTDHV